MKRDDLINFLQCGTEQGSRMTLTPNGTEVLTSRILGSLTDASLWRMALSVDASEKFQDGFRDESRTLPPDTRGRHQVGT